MQGNSNAILKKSIDLQSFRPGAPIQWRNTYSQWQNAEFVEYLAHGRCEIREMKNDRLSRCTPDRLRARYDDDGKPFEQQF